MRVCWLSLRDESWAFVSRSQTLSLIQLRAVHFPQPTIIALFLSLSMRSSLSHTLLAPSHPSRPRCGDLAPTVCLSLVAEVLRARRTGPCHWIMQGNPRESPPSLSVCVQTRVSSFMCLACLLHQIETCLNRCFRWTRAFLTLQTALQRRPGPEKVFFFLVVVVSAAFENNILCYL